MVFGSSSVTTADWIRETRTHVQGSSREQVNTLASSKSASATQIELQYPLTGVQVGQAIEIGWVTYLVADLDTSARTLDVLPEVEGSGAAADTGARVTMRPTYSTRRIIDQLNNDLRDLSAQGLYRLETVEAIDGAADVPIGGLVVLDAWSEEPGLKSRQLPAKFYQIADTPEGTQLRGPSTLQYVTFGCMFNELPYDQDVNIVDTTGLWATAVDIPPLGAAMSMLGGAEAQRNITTHQGDTRRAEEVPPGAISGALQTLATLRQRRIVAEGQRLTSRYGHIIDVGVY